MRIDIHTHAFHPKIAQKAVDQLRSHYRVEPRGLGTLEDLLARARGPHPDGLPVEVELDKVVLLCAATTPAQVRPANDFALSLLAECPHVVPFGAMHPDFMQPKGQPSGTLPGEEPDDKYSWDKYAWEKELERLRQAGIKGLKLHADFQGFRLDDPRLWPLFEAAQNDFIFMCHIGDILPPEKNPSCPAKLAALLDNFPKARFIGAHFGGYKHWKLALEKLVGRKVYLDTSSALFEIEDQLLQEIMRRHPREYILFGSDYPLFDPQDEFRLLQKRLKPSSAETDELLGNAARLLF